jgi:MerR family transcriptional regulator, thiopeptide resistance regulator
MTDSLPIQEVARRTGLSSRALRFYETKGLVKPLRTASGRRLFSQADLARLHQIIVLKSAGLSLSQMQRLFAGYAVDSSAMLAAQLKMLDEEAAQIENSRRIIRLALSRLERGNSVDTETLCALIETSDRMMNREPKEWQSITDRYFTVEEKARWAEAWDAINANFNDGDYDAQWKALGDRIAAALPMDPLSELAQAFVDEWFDLLRPFSSVSTLEMWQSTMKMYDEMDEWADDGTPDPGFDKKVWDFMKQATAARILRGGALPGVEMSRQGE